MRTAFAGYGGHFTLASGIPTSELNGEGEHKSYYDPNIYTQLLEYLSLIYAKQMKNMKKYQIVIPLVLYHGKEGWNLGTKLLYAFDLSKEEQGIQEFIPNFSINLYHLKPENPDFPTEILSLKLLLRILQHIRDEPERYLSALRQTMKDLSLEKVEWKRVAILETRTIHAPLIERGL